MCLLSKASPDVVSAQQRRDAEQAFVAFQHSQASFDVCKNLLGQCYFQHYFYTLYVLCIFDLLLLKCEFFSLHNCFCAFSTADCFCGVCRDEPE